LQFHADGDRLSDVLCRNFRTKLNTTIDVSQGSVAAVCEVGKSITVMLPTNSVYCMPNIVEIGQHNVESTVI